LPHLVRKTFALVRDRRDAGARVRNKLDQWFDRLSTPCRLSHVIHWDELGSGVARLFRTSDESPSLPEPLAIERHINLMRHPLGGPFPIGGFHNGTVTLGRLCYLACRQLRPRIVVETGVAYGVTSTYILKALSENGEGELQSVDLPPLAHDAERYVGYFIPTELRERWTLHVGPAKKLLPNLLQQAQKIDMFVHDSLHTYHHMRWEFEAALSVLRPGGILIADDIQGNRAFEELLDQPEVDSWVAIRQQGKNAVCGAVRIK
jgi:predicted O-methyltransferase YrrM